MCLCVIGVGGGVGGGEMLSTEELKGGRYIMKGRTRSGSMRRPLLLQPT